VRAYLRLKPVVSSGKIDARLCAVEIPGDEPAARERLERVVRLSAVSAGPPRFEKINSRTE
jgi:hypothetical protein